MIWTFAPVSHKERLRNSPTIARWKLDLDTFPASAADDRGPPHSRHPFHAFPHDHRPLGAVVACDFRKSWLFQLVIFNGTVLGPAPKTCANLCIMSKPSDRHSEFRSHRSKSHSGRFPSAMVAGPFDKNRHHRLVEDNFPPIMRAKQRASVRRYPALPPTRNPIIVSGLNGPGLD